jgi:putative tetratricopeptide repeat-containing domain protein
MKAYQLFILLIIGVISSYCSLDLPPEDEVSDPNAITSVTSAQRLLASAYSSYKPYSNALTWVLRSDDLIPTQYLAREVNLQNTYNWNDRELVNHSEDIWKSLYNTIAQCNALLERLPNVTPQNSSQRRELQLVQQRATYLKALCYFDLLRIFSPAFGQPNIQPYGILFKN